MRAEVRARLERLLGAAREIADPSTSIGQRARERLVRSTRLSAEGVELALSRYLETAPSEAELSALASRTEPSERTHVLLSANVCIAAHRAIAIALAASGEVFVRPSRRDPALAELLAELAPELFHLVERLEPAPGDQVFAYGSRETLTRVRESLPAGARYHAKGPGFGLVVAEGSALASSDQRERLAHALAPDIGVFDQRGCLSPRLLLLQGDEATALELARALGDALARFEADVPLGACSPEELAEIARFRDTCAYAGELLPAGQGSVGVLRGTIRLAPPGRQFVVVVVEDAVAHARELAEHVTTFAVLGDSGFVRAIGDALPRARAAAPGRLQRPPFDGPVDLRASR